MNIKEKLCEPFGGLKMETANELEKICDDYATQYAEWCCARALSVNYFKLNEEELDQFKVVTGDTEGLVNFGLGLKGIVFSVLIIDRTERVKMSFRSKGKFPANEFAGQYFSGGGHFNAAGGQSEEDLETVVKKFRMELVKYKEQLKQIANEL